MSYLFTWKDDQDQVINKSFIDFMFVENGGNVENWLGKFGAYSSHKLMYNTFGLSSIAFCILFLFYGLRILFNVKLFSLKSYSIKTIFLGVWLSLFLGFFSEKNTFLGGALGFHTNEWLVLSLGSIGALLTYLGILYVLITILFNPNYSALFAFLKPVPSKKNHLDDIEEQVSKQNETDFKVINTIKDEEIKEEEVSETIEFGEKEEVEINEPKTDKDKELEKVKDEFEIEVPEEEKLVESTEPTIVEENPDDLSADLLKEIGEYDPKLDLSDYTLPPIDLLKDYGGGSLSVDKEELERNKDRIVETLANYKIAISKIKATVGPTVTLYELVPAPGIRISKIKNLEDDIALSLSALGIRIIAPIPGKGTIGIEVPNSKPDMVSMRSLIASEKFQNSDGELPVVMGKTITNETFTFDLTKMPHLLVAGATGQGKSVGLNAILVSLLYKKHPSQIKFILVDPKKVELAIYNKIERHFLAKLPDDGDAIITDTSKVVATLNSLCVEMDQRYELLKEALVRNIKEYNQKFINRKLNPERGHRYLPYIVLVIDEFADLIMTAGKEVETPIARLAQLARAIGIHLIVATQRPSVNVITGIIKANFPARIAFRVTSSIDSKTILDSGGANQLIGRGDMLFSNGNDVIRIQCGFVDTPEVDDIVDYIGTQRGYPEAFLLPEYIEETAETREIDDELDSLFEDAAEIIVNSQQGSASLLQRKLKLGYNRAGRIIDQLEATGLIGGHRGSKAREVLIPDVLALEQFLKDLRDKGKLN
ncbi:MAG: DNA translocase FtsK 4TM domain-containing protein [Crocinitomicaceae bacterium]|nr:DNA translocase FtsK 4TM domain-containing protein [Crocinitomicaceae bacterium]